MADRYIRKPVAFNRDDPDHMTLYNFAMKRSSFSEYIRRLIQRDMDGSGFGAQTKNPGWTAEDDEPTIDTSHMTELI